MPSRLGVLAIVFFWMVSTGWLIMREILPLFRTGEPPAFFIDVTDEVGGTTISWRILHKGAKVGAGFSQVRPRPDRTFELTTDLHFETFKILIFEVKRISGRYRVTPKGHLLEVATTVKLGGANDDLKAEVKGKVENGVLTPHIYINGVKPDLAMLNPSPINVAGHGNVLNTMHLLNKIPGLKEGQWWKVPLLDPLGAIMPGKNLTIPMLVAEVATAELAWQGQQVACFRIDYSEPGKRATAHTWVRRSDGLVLQQEGKHRDMELVLVREMGR